MTDEAKRRRHVREKSVMTMSPATFSSHRLNLQPKRVTSPNRRPTPGCL
jgi:hypothetical protein